VAKLYRDTEGLDPDEIDFTPSSFINSRANKKYNTLKSHLKSLPSYRRRYGKIKLGEYDFKDPTHRTCDIDDIEDHEERLKQLDFMTNKLGEVENTLSSALKEQEELKKMYSERLDGVMTREAFDKYLEEERSKRKVEPTKKTKTNLQHLENYYGITKNELNKHNHNTLLIP